MERGSSFPTIVPTRSSEIGVFQSGNAEMLSLWVRT